LAGVSALGVRARSRGRAKGKREREPSKLKAGPRGGR